MAGYIGTTPVPQATQHRESFTATGGQTSFATAGYTPQFIDVYLNGVKLAPADYTATNGSDVVLASGATASDILEIVAYTPFEVANQTFTGDTSVTNLAVTGTFTSRGIDDNADAVAITIDSSENVGIGTSSPDYPLHVKGATNILKLETTSNGRTQLGGYDSAGNANFLVGSTDSTNAEFWNYKNGYLRFATNSAEAMRLDASGNLLVGKTSDNAAISGSIFNGNGDTYLTAEGTRGRVLYLNRLTSDGTIIDLRKDGTTVGSIGVASSDNIYLAGNSSHAAIGLGTNSLYPADSVGNAVDNSDDLGGVAFRWKDLYLSGGVYLGGTGAANQLDDYEEGTFNLALSTTATSNGYVLSSQNCRYTKVGNVCYVTGEFNFSTVPSSYDGAVGFTGLPFTSGFSNAHQIGVAREVSTSGDMFVTQISQNLAEIGMNAMDGITNTDNQSILANKTYSFSNTYITT